MAFVAHAVRTISLVAAHLDGGTLAHVRAALSACADIMLAAAVRPGADVTPAAGLLPDVALVDAVPGVVREILAVSPATNVVVLTADVDRDRIVASVAAGAGGYLLSDDDPAGLEDAVRAAARGESPLAPRAARALISGHRLARRDGRLPAVEKQVLGLLARGCTDRDIRARLGITPGELDRALDVVAGALGVADRTQAALWAQRHGYDGGDGDPARLLPPLS